MAKKQREKQKKVHDNKRVGGRLLFDESIRGSGLTPLSVSIKEPPAVVREIIQNSLDAANEADRDCAEVEFCVEDVECEEIPGMNEYRTAVDRVADWQESWDWPEQSKEIVDSIRKQISKTKIPVMYVSDNGIGLNKRLMTGMLYDGQTCKGNTQSLGSHGNGHFSTFALSELRYILYAGLSKEDGLLVSGHAILSSHIADDDTDRGGDGYFVERFDKKARSRKDPSPYVFPNDRGSIPPMLLKKLDETRQRWGTGTVLAIVGFNSFSTEDNDSSKENIADLILATTALNFFVAIHRNQLKVSVKIGDLVKQVSSSNLDSLLSLENKRFEVTKFPKYASARNFYRVLQAGKPEEVETEAGTAMVYYSQVDCQNTNIALCRSGMWITQSVPSIKREHFTDRVPFSALILADWKNDGELPKLIRKAEGNLHNSLELSAVKDPTKRARLRKALQKVRDELRELIDEYNAKYYDFVQIDAIGIMPETTPKLGNKIVVVDDGPPGAGPGTAEARERGGAKGGKAGTNNITHRQKPGKDLLVRCVSVRSGDNSIQIRVTPETDAPEVGMRLQINGGADITCDSVQEGNTIIKLSKVLCDGEECHVDEDGFAHIRSLSIGENKLIKAWFESSELSDGCRIDYQFVRRTSIT